MKNMLKIKSLLLPISLILILIFGGCAKKNISSINDQNEKNIYLSENLDFNKEVIFTAIGIADYAVAAPKDINELYETSKYVVSGKAVASELCIDKETGFTYTLVKFQKQDLLKGDMSGRDFSVAYIGGYMSGEKYMEVHPDFKMSIIKGTDEKEVKEELRDKIIKVGVMPGEEIPRVGKSYILFLASHNLDLYGKEYHYSAGYEFAQGLFEINNGRVREFSPEDREEAFNKAINSKVTDKEILEAMAKATEEIDVEDFISRIKNK